MTMLILGRSPESNAAPLEAARSNANLEIMKMTSKVRSHYLTAIVGQEMTYQEKETQANAFLAATPEPTVPGSKYTFIFAEVGITAPTPLGVAQRIAYVASLFRTQVGPAIERLRLLAVKNIKEAEAPADIDVFVEEFLVDMGELL